MHRCNSIGSCSCNSFSMLFTKPAEMYSSSVVDCTLSLGTPSTRLCDDHDERRSNYFSWDLLHTKHSPSVVPHSHKISRGSGSGGGDCFSSNESLLARRCANCDTTSTPLWRNGPRGPKSLCNACGIRFKKEERRTSAAASTTTGSTPGGGLHKMEQQQHMLSYQTQKTAYISPSSIGNEFRFIDDSSRDSDTGISFLSWRLNVTDRPSLVHDFTR